MPNWCQNEVRVYAEDRGKAEAFVGFVRDGDNYFSFNKIMPLPDELKGTRSPIDIVSQEEYDRNLNQENRPITLYPSATTQTPTDVMSVMFH